jgi:hypothetical protein
MALIPAVEWRTLSPRAKIERLVGRSLDDIDEMLSIPLLSCEPAMLAARVQVIRVILMTAAKLGIEQRRAEDWAGYMRVLDREAAALGKGKRSKRRSADAVDADG